MKHGVIYKGLRTAEGTCLVTCDGAALQTRTELRKHSATGFDWGQNSGGSSQLALAMLCDFFRDDNKALEYYEEFRTDILAPIGGTTWTIKSESMIEWTRHKMKERKSAGQNPTI